MKRLFFILFVSILSINFVSSQESIITPQIVKTFPDFGDCSVDPSIKEVIIEFNQDMNSGMSLVNCPDMPNITGQAKWIDKRKLSIPVKLYSNRIYQLAFNNERFSNFTNEAGVPLNQTLLIFQTRQINCQKENKLSFSEFTDYFPDHYPFSGLKNIDWKNKLSEYKVEFENTTTQLEFGLKLDKFLSLTEDPHISIDADGEHFVPCPMKYVLKNYNFDVIYKNLNNMNNSKNFAVMSGRYKDIAYLNIGTWNNDQKDEIEQAIDRLKDFKDEANIIIDVRGNSGGNESIAKEIASCFVKDSVSYEKVIYYNETTGKFDKEEIKKLYSNKDGIYYAGYIYVLIGNKVMSSNESFVLMMKQAAKAKIIGMRIYGSSGNPKPMTLSNGVIVYIPIMAILHNGWEIN